MNVPPSHLVREAVLVVATRIELVERAFYTIMGILVARGEVVLHHESGLVSLGGQVIAHQPMTGPGGNAVAPKQSPLYSEFCVVVQICRQCAGPPDAICF